MQELNEYLKVRKDLYLFLAKAFYKEADGKYLDDAKKRAPVFMAVSDLFRNDGLKAGCEILNGFFAEIERIDKAKLTEELACEFANLFLGIRGALGEPSVALSESVYLSSRKIAMQEERDAVVRFYDRCGKHTDDSFHEPEDHISSELAFLSVMSSDAAACIEGGEEDNAEKAMRDQLEFIDQHIGRWVGLVEKGMTASAKSGFYNGIAKVVHGFVISDREFLSSVLDDEA